MNEAERKAERKPGRLPSGCIATWGPRQEVRKRVGCLKHKRPDRGAVESRMCQGRVEKRGAVEVTRGPVFRGQCPCHGLFQRAQETPGGGVLNKENLCSQLCRKIMVITEKQFEIGQGGDGFPLLLGLDGAPARDCTQVASCGMKL